MAENLLYGFYESHIAETRLALPVALAFFLFLFWQRLAWKRDWPRYLKGAAAGMCLALEGWIVGVFCSGTVSAAAVAAWNGFWLAVMAASLAAGGWIYRDAQKKLLLIKQYAQEDSPVRDLVGAWRLLQQLREPALTGRQRERCLRDRIYVAMELGNMPEADQLIDSCLENPAAGGETAYHFYKNVLCLKQGRWEEAAVHARKAEASCGTRTDPLMAAQIIHNRAVSFVARGEYRNADKDFREALERLSAGERGGAAAFFFGFVAHGKRRAEKSSPDFPEPAIPVSGEASRKLWGEIQANFLLNRIRLEGRDMDWETPLLRMEQSLKKEELAAWLLLENLRLDLMRETGAPVSALNVFVNETFLRLVEMPELPLENRLVYAAGTARMVWAQSLDPAPCLRYLAAHEGDLFSLPMPARFRAVKELYTVFSSLSGNLPEEICRLRAAVFCYWMERARMELAEYGNSSALPAAAVYPRIALHQDLASFGRFQNPYPLEQVCSLFESAILLCQENGLLLEEAECRLNEMDEMFGLWNLDEDGRTNHPDRVWDQFVRMEEREADFARLPGSTGIYVRLAYYAFCLGDGRRLLDYYRKYAEKEMRYSLDHFAPHLRRYAVITGFLARACCFEEAVQKIQNGREVRGYAEEVREWFADPGAGDGKRLALLLGYFINGKKRQWIKTCEWREEKTGQCRHSWLVLAELGLELDAFYGRFPMETHPERRWFIQGRHPMETGRSVTLRQSLGSPDAEPPRLVQESLAFGDLPAGEQALLNEICRRIEQKLNSSCPPLEKLIAQFRKNVPPQPAPAYRS